METRIQVLIKEKTKYGDFNDALYFSPEEYETKTAEDIQALADERVANFISSIETPREISEPTINELKKQKENLLSQLEEVNNQLDLI